MGHTPARETERTCERERESQWSEGGSHPSRADGSGTASPPRLPRFRSCQAGAAGRREAGCGPTWHDVRLPSAPPSIGRRGPCVRRPAAAGASGCLRPRAPAARGPAAAPESPAPSSTPGCHQGAFHPQPVACGSGGTWTSSACSSCSRAAHSPAQAANMALPLSLSVCLSLSATGALPRLTSQVLVPQSGNWLHHARPRALPLLPPRPPPFPPAPM